MAVDDNFEKVSFISSSYNRMKPKKKVVIYPDNKDANESSELKQKSNENNE